MDGLYKLLRDLLEIEHQITSLLYVIEILEDNYVINKKDELLLLLSVHKLYLSAVKSSITESLNLLDESLLLLKKRPLN